MSIFKSIASVGKGILGVVAPTLATAIPGPLGGLAKNIVTKALGLDAEANDAEIEKALAAADPETLKQLREIDAKFKTDMRQLDVDLAKLDVEDRASARAREIALKDYMPKVLASMIVGGYIALQWLLLTHALPPENRDIILRSLGIVEGVMLAVVYYYFGSSAGSNRKTELMKKD